MTNESRWKQSWLERPVEEARIFNPAFCGELLARTVGEYYNARQTELTIITAFLVLPLTLHNKTREALPKRANAAFSGWIAEHDAMLADLPQRVRYLRPISREALLFAVHYQILAINSQGLLPGALSLRRSMHVDNSTEEVKLIRSAARLLGRWFASQRTETIILQGIGVTP